MRPYITERKEGVNALGTSLDIVCFEKTEEGASRVDLSGGGHSGKGERRKWV